VVSSGRRVLVPQYDAFQWEFLSSPRRLLSVLFICILVMLVDLNAFFIKFVLWIPPPHHLVLGRLFLWFLIGLPALRELYQFITDR
jgi:phosphatidylserine synthase 2